MKEPCPRCHELETQEGHDPCIANLPGVSYACCGHGERQGYILFENGTRIGMYMLEVDNYSGWPDIKRIMPPPLLWVVNWCDYATSECLGEDGNTDPTLYAEPFGDMYYDIELAKRHAVKEWKKDWLESDDVFPSGRWFCREREEHRQVWEFCDRRSRKLMKGSPRVLGVLIAERKEIKS